CLPHDLELAILCQVLPTYKYMRA
ncbi:unnamed protein product, partial [Caretta caretta]